VTRPSSRRAPGPAGCAWRLRRAPRPPVLLPARKCGIWPAGGHATAPLARPTDRGGDPALADPARRSRERRARPRASGSSYCVNATLGLLDGSHRLNASLLIRAGRRLVDTRFASFRLGSALREEDGPLPAILAVRAGCPRTLQRRLGRFLDKRAPVCVKVSSWMEHRCSACSSDVRAAASS